MLLMMVLLGGIAGTALFAFNDKSEEPAVAADAPTTTPRSRIEDNSTKPDNTQPTNSTITPEVDTRSAGAFPQFGRSGANMEPIRGTLTSLSPTGLVVTSNDTGADTEMTVPPETPVRLSEAAGDTSALTAGTEIVAFLQRDADGAISASSINIPSIGSTRGTLNDLRGAARGELQSGGRATSEGNEFNAVPGTITSLAGGALTLETVEGSLNVTVADDTPVQLTIAFGDLKGQLATDSEITVIGQRDDTGTYTPIIIASGSSGGFGGAVDTFGGRRRNQQGGGGIDRVPQITQ